MLSMGGSRTDQLDQGREDWADSQLCHNLVTSEHLASIDAYCTCGSFETLGRWLTRGGLYVLLGAGAEIPPDTALKDLEKLVPSTEVWVVREGVAAYLAGEWSPEDGRHGVEQTSPAEVQPTATPVP